MGKVDLKLRLFQNLFFPLLFQLNSMMTMTAENKNQGIAYRQFSRERYAELKKTNGSMREAEIIRKIIKEWQNLTMKEKIRMGGMQMCQIIRNQEVMGTPIKMNQEMKMVKESLKSTIDKKTQNKMSEDKDEMIKQEKMDMGMSKKAIWNKSKQIQKNSSIMQNSYMEFYRAQFSILSRQHPNWTMSQKSKIIILKWRQVKKSMMRSNKDMNSKPKRMMNMSEMRRFKMLKRSQGMSNADSTQMWRRFAFETKNSWQNQSQMTPRMNRNIVTMNLRNQTPEMRKEVSIFQLMRSS